jgi:hypothetical protein
MIKLNKKIICMFLLGIFMFSIFPVILSQEEEFPEQPEGGWCGDLLCNPNLNETAENCPEDCSEESLALYGFDSNQLKDNYFFSSLAFKIIIIVIGVILILLGIIAYLKYHRKKISTTQIT